MAETHPSVILLRRLLQRTQDGRVAWQEASVGAAFLTPFSDHSIEVVDLGSDYDPDYAVRILDDEGRLVEEIKLGELSTLMSSNNLATKLMRELFVAARRSAKGADKVVKSIIDALGDDDEPF